MNTGLKFLIRNFIKNAAPHTSAARSFHAFHAEGTAYVNLAFSPEVVVKLYFFDPAKLRLLPDRLPTSGPGIVVNPHSHLYDFDTVVLSGSVANVLYSRAASSKEVGGSWWYEQRYRSPLREPDKGKYSGCIGQEKLLGHSGQDLKAGESYTLSHEKINSIRVSLEEETILFLVQQRDQDSDYTSLFTPTPALPDMRGLYLPMSKEDVAARLEKALAML